jgi:DNA repair protein RadC
VGHRPTSAIMQGTLFDCGEPPAQTKKKKQKDQGAYWVTTRLIRESGPHYLAPIKSPDQVVEIMRNHIDMENLDREMFCAIYLNRKNNVLAINTVSVGGLASSLVHPREIFKPAFLTSAAAIILVHNHPSGDPTPSAEDLNITRRLAEAGKLLGIEVLDHIIIGVGRHISLKSENRM